jgi:hypothetical protein
MCTHVATVGDQNPSTDNFEVKNAAFVLREPTCNGCTPQVDVLLNNEIVASVTGQLCFGGCSEMCFDQGFVVTDKAGQPVAEIVKMRPSGLMEACAEMMTDSDCFRITLTGDANSAFFKLPEYRYLLLSINMLLEFMFFENDNGMLDCADGSLHITCFNCYCCGMICPCKCDAAGGNNDSGGGD